MAKTAHAQAVAVGGAHSTRGVWMDGVGGVGWEVYMVRQVKCGWVGGLVYTGGEVIPCGGLLFVYTCVGVFWWGRRGTCLP